MTPEQAKIEVQKARTVLINAITQAALAKAKLEVLRSEVSVVPEQVSQTASDFRNKERIAHEAFGNLMDLQCQLLVSADAQSEEVTTTP